MKWYQNQTSIVYYTFFSKLYQLYQLGSKLYTIFRSSSNSKLYYSLGLIPLNSLGLSFQKYPSFYHFSKSFFFFLSLFFFYLLVVRIIFVVFGVVVIIKQFDGVFRDSQRMWMAEDRGMGESWSLLLSWVTLCHYLHFCVPFWREGIYYELILFSLIISSLLHIYYSYKFSTKPCTSLELATAWNSYLFFLLRSKVHLVIVDLKKMEKRISNMSHYQL